MLKTLEALEAEIDESFSILNHPPKPFVPLIKGPDGELMLDVLIIGGGMNGLAAAFALRRFGVLNIRQLDAKPAGFAGPWRNYARMQFLRSGKNQSGPSLDQALLTPQAWWQASRPNSDWKTFEYFGREDWAEYLEWYAKVTQADVEYETIVSEIVPKDEYVAIKTLDSKGIQSCTYARQVVLATGREGLAKPRIPDAFQTLRGDSRVCHSSKFIDFSSVTGQDVAVVGLAASAFDNAAVLAESGANVTIIGRAREVPRMNKMKHTVTSGFAEGFPLLADHYKLKWLRHITASRIAPPKHTVERVSKLGVNIVTDTKIIEVCKAGEQLVLMSDNFSMKVDKVILATGFTVDLFANAAIASFVDEIQLWRDKMPPETWVTADEEWAAFPYLSQGFGFQPKQAKKSPALGRVRCFNHGAQLSLGNLANDIPHTSFGAERLAKSIVADLFVEDRDYHFQTLQDYNELELDGEEWPGRI